MKYPATTIYVWLEEILVHEKINIWQLQHWAEFEERESQNRFFFWFRNVWASLCGLMYVQSFTQGCFHMHSSKATFSLRSSGFKKRASVQVVWNLKPPAHRHWEQTQTVMEETSCVPHLNLRNEIYLHVHTFFFFFYQGEVDVISGILMRLLHFFLQKSGKT